MGYFQAFEGKFSPKRRREENGKCDLDKGTYGLNRVIIVTWGTFKELSHLIKEVRYFQNPAVSPHLLGEITATRILHRIKRLPLMKLRDLLLILNSSSKHDKGFTRANFGPSVPNDVDALVRALKRVGLITPIPLP